MIITHIYEMPDGIIKLVAQGTEYHPRSKEKDTKLLGILMEAIKALADRVGIRVKHTKYKIVYFPDLENYPGEYGLRISTSATRGARKLQIF
jgi:hypothetical protein